MDRELVARARDGDHEAFAALAREAGDRLYPIAVRILRDPDAARDATQQTLLAAWRDLRGLRDAARWEAWTYRLLVNACYKLGRRDRIHADAVRRLPQPGDEPDAANAIADRDALERAFRALSAEHRAVVVLHHHLGLSLVEVADVLGIPAGTARSRLHHATRRLRAAIEEPQGVLAEGRTA